MAVDGSKTVNEVPPSEYTPVPLPLVAGKPPVSVTGASLLHKVSSAAGSVNVTVGAVATKIVCVTGVLLVQPAALV